MPPTTPHTSAPAPPWTAHKRVRNLPLYVQQLPGQTLPQLFDTMNQSMLGQHVDLGRATYSMPLLTKVRSLLDKSKNPITQLPDMDPQLLARSPPPPPRPRPLPLHAPPQCMEAMHV